MLKYLVLFASTALLSLLLTPLVRGAASRIGALDLPGGRKVHERPTPRCGGIVIFVGFYLVLFIFEKVNQTALAFDFAGGINLGWFFIASALIFLMGTVDDFHPISPGVKFMIQILAALIVALTCCRVSIVSLPFGELRLGPLAIPATVMWIVAITNGLNLLDGLDGLAAGTSFLAAMAIFGISILNQNVGCALITIILAGTVLGFLRYNFHPASIFLGDSGAYTLGFILSILSLQSNLKGTTAVIFLVPILILGLPILDTLLSMARRLLKSLHIVKVDPRTNSLRFFFVNGRAMFQADRDHIHHRLLALGLTQRNAVILLYGITLLLGACALATAFFRDTNQALLLTSVCLASCIGLHKLGYREMRFLRNGTLLPLFDLSQASRRVFKVLADISFIGLAYYLGFLLRFDGTLPPAIKKYCLATFPLVIVVKLVVFYWAGLYRGTLRTVDVDDFLRIFRGVGAGCAAAAIFLLLAPAYGVANGSVLFIDGALLFLFIAGSRSSFRILAHLHVSPQPPGRPGPQTVSAAAAKFSPPQLPLFEPACNQLHRSV